MLRWNKKRKIFLGFVFLFLAVHVLQPIRNKNKLARNSIITKATAVPDSVLKVLKIACYDCHSNYTHYPWSSWIVPLNWWIADHIEEGKREVNFDIFNKYSPRRQTETLQAIAEAVKSKSMLLPFYLLMHGDARLNKNQRQMIVAWATRENKKRQLTIDSIRR